MTWLTWRQFRVPALSVFIGLAAIGVVLAITGPDLVGRTNYSDQDTLFGSTILALYLLPAVIGVFWGVPLVTRELETGTHSLVWNQTVTRKRWLATKLGVGALTALVAGGLLSLAVTWWASPIDAMANTDVGGESLNRMTPVVFAARAIAPIGYAAFAFVLGVAVGIALRRTVAAMAVTLVVFAAVMVAVPFLVRPYILPALQETVTVTESNIRQISASEEGGLEEIGVTYPAGSWLLANETVDKNGTVITAMPDSAKECLPRPGDGPPPFGSLTKCIADSLTSAGYQQRLTFQPGYRFWPLQWIELAFFLALSALLTWFCFRRLRHLS